MTRPRPVWLALFCALPALYSFGSRGSDRVTTAAVRVRYVFIVVLENKSFGETFVTRPGKMTFVSTLTPVENITVNGYGGDQIGALLLSLFIKPGSTSETPYNHYSLLRSLEDIFRLHEHLGYAADDPRTGYHLDTIGNDHSVFQGEFSHESGLFPNPQS